MFINAVIPNHEWRDAPHICDGRRLEVWTPEEAGFWRRLVSASSRTLTPLAQTCAALPASTSISVMSGWRLLTNHITSKERTKERVVEEEEREGEERGGGGAYQKEGETFLMNESSTFNYSTSFFLSVSLSRSLQSITPTLTHHPTLSGLISLILHTQGICNPLILVQPSSTL